MFNPYPFQHKIIGSSRTAFKEGFFAPAVVSPTGSGKCLGENTKILMYDGTIRKVQHIKVNDKIMGPDSKPRIVKSICSGMEQLYKIIPTKGDPWICNESHILSLKISPDNKQGGTVCGNKTYHDNEIANVELKDYLKASKTFKHRAKQWKTGVDFNQQNKFELLIEPYFLGLWLGDGHSKGIAITTEDEEIKDYVIKYAKLTGNKTRIEYNSENSENVHIIGKRRTGRGGSPMMNAFKQYNLIQNKHIPYEYLTSTKENRLKLLAGIIDTDGSAIISGYDLTLKSEKLMNDVIFLCRSLGFSCYKSKVKKKCHNNGKIGNYFRININGELNELPVLLKRKKVNKRKQIKNHLVTGIKVEKYKYGKYYGFEIEGPDRLFLLSDFTVTHNTIIFAYIAYHAMLKGNRVLILVHREEILQQTLLKLYSYGIQAGQIISGRPMTRDKVQVAMVATLVHRLGRFSSDAFDLIIIDETHHCVANTWLKIFQHFSKVPRLGFTATPERQDGTGLISVHDKLILGPTPAYLVEEGYLSYPVMKTTPKEIKDKIPLTRGDFDKETQVSIMTRKAIVGDVIEHYKQYLDGMPTIVSCVSIKHAYLMAEYYNKYARETGKDWKAVVVQGGQKYKKERKDGLDGLANGSVQQVCFCDVISEGVDVPLVVGCQNLRRSTSLSFVLQVWGRVLRAVYTDGYDLSTKIGRLSAIANGIKPEAIILDHAGNRHLHGHVLADRDWSLNHGKRNHKKDKVPTTTSCPKCYGVWPGEPKRCPDCGFVFADNPNIAGQQRKLPEQIAGELIDALPDGVDPEKLKDLTKFVGRLQRMDGKTRQKAMLAMAYKLQNKDEIKALTKAVGYKKGWTDFVWKNLMGNRS